MNRFGVRIKKPVTDDVSAIRPTIMMAAPEPERLTASTSLDEALENHMSRFNVRIKKPVIDDGSTILAPSLLPHLS
jgi:hypothetical protein